MTQEPHDSTLGPESVLAHYAALGYKCVGFVFVKLAPPGHDGSQRTEDEVFAWDGYTRPEWRRQFLENELAGNYTTEVLRAQ